MKIVFVVDQFAPAWGYGGPPRLVATLADQFTRMGHEIEVLTTDALSARRYLSGRDEPILNYRVIRARNLSNELAWYRKLFLPVAGGGVMSCFRDADIVHVFQARSLLNLIACFGAWCKNAALVMSPLGSLPLVGGWDRAPKMMYDKICSRHFKRRVQALFGQTEHEMQVGSSCGFGESRIHLVPLCVNLLDYNSLPPAGRFVSRVSGLRNFDQKYIFIGRIHRYKGLEMLTRAFSKAFQHRNHALVIAGKDEGGFVSYLQKLSVQLDVSSRVFFPGPLYGVEKLEALVDSHAFVITPSIYEETSLAALEAAACKTPVVTGVQSEIPWLEEYAAGFSVQYSLDAIADGLIKMADVIGDDRQSMGRRSRKLVEDHFSPKVVADGMERIYDSLLRRASQNYRPESI